MKCQKTECQKSQPRLIMKNDKMLKSPQAGPEGLGDEPKGPAGLEDDKEVG